MHRKKIPIRQVGLNHIYRYYQKNSERRGLKFEIPFALFEELIFSRCNYCGCSPRNKLVRHGREAFNYNGIDRLKNSVGYTIENTATCCGVCNRLKGVQSRIEFLQRVESIHSNIKRARSQIGFDEISEWRDSVDGKRISLVTGCFDLLHVGHLEIFRDAKSVSDILIVGINSDRSITALKGPGRPLYSQHVRAALISSVELVDHVSIFDSLTADKIIRATRATVWLKGGDFSISDLPECEVEAAREVGTRLILSQRTTGQSTTKTIEKLKKTL